MLIGNRYEVEEQIGTGGMGTVFRGVDTQTHQVIAVKQLKSEALSAETGMIARFKREGEALRQLNHPNIVKMIAALDEGDSHYLVMEYFPGGDLKNLLKQQRLPISQTLQIALDLADALTRAHRLNIIHRDLKPANVLMAEDGTPRLTDFGVAVMRGQERVTDSGLVMGTMDYLPPEVLKGERVDPRGDIWAFGIMLFEMLAGQRPFTGETAAQVITAILSEPTPDLEVFCPEAPIALVDLVYRMLEKESVQRIASVRLVGAELEAILRGDKPSPQVERRSRNARATADDAPTTFGTRRFETPTPAITDRPKHNLPAQTTPFVGREAEISELAKLLDAARLVTILAPGGMGKTRLALEVGGKLLSPHPPPPSPSGFTGENPYTNGVYFVSLAPLSAAENIVPAVAEAVGFQFYPSGEPKQQLLDFFRQKHMLLLMDNFEHLIEGVGLVNDILQAAPGVKIVATSRQRLNLSGETIFNLSGMDFPDWETPEDALQYSAVKLFMQSARRVRPDFELHVDDLKYVARICRLVRGMPLGILLAAAWVDALLLKEITDEIGKSLDFLESEMSDLPKRQRSIRAVFDYSWNLLTENERIIFSKLSVFRGGFTREAAQAVAEAGLRQLTALVNKSLLRRDPNSGRYEVHELLRQYGEQRLSPEETNAAREAHCGYYAELFRRLGIDLKGPNMVLARETALTEDENTQLAWMWAAQQVKYTELWAMFYALITTQLFFKHRIQILITLLSSAIDALQPLVSTPERDELLGTLLGGVAVGQIFSSSPEKFLKDSEGSLAILSRFTVPPVHPETALLLAWLGNHLAGYESRTQGEIYIKRAIVLCREADYRFELFTALAVLVGTSLNNGESVGMESLLKEMNELAEESRNPLQLSMVKTWLGIVAQIDGNLGEAKRLFLEAYPLLETTGQWQNLTAVQSSLGDIALTEGNYAEAKTWLNENLKIYTNLGNSMNLAGSLCVQAKLFVSMGDKVRAVELSVLTLTHPKTKDSWADLNVKPLLVTLEAELPPDVYAAAYERGKGLDLDDVVAELLKEET